MLNRVPGDSEFQRLITTNATKVFGSLGWSSHAFRSGIEDRYLISLQPSIVDRLQSNFSRARTGTLVQPRLPDRFHSVTYYKFDDPAAVWQDLKAAASSQMDVLSAVFFRSILKSALVSYGIDEPERFLAAVKGELLTLRLDQSGDRTMVIAGVRDQGALRETLKKKIGLNSRSDASADNEVFEDARGGWAISLNKDLVVLGSPSDVRRYSEDLRIGGPMMTDEDLQKVTAFVPLSSSANIVTYTNDSDRVATFIASILAAKGMRLAPGGIEARVAELPYSATETTLSERGFERVTRSPLGQFSTLLPLVIPENPGPTKNNTPSQ
jgi:hypothetical protein